MLSKQKSKIKYVPEVSFYYRSDAFELEVVELETLQQRSNQWETRPNLPHRLGFNILIVIEQGTGYHLIDFEKTYFQAGSVLFVNKGQIQAFDFSNKLKGKVIIYTELFLTRLHSKLSIPFSLGSTMPKTFVPHISLNKSLEQSTMRLIDELNVEISQANPFLEIIISLFGALIMILSRERKNLTYTLPSSHLKKFVAFQKIIESHYNDTREAGFYADKLGITYKTLNLLCKKISGVTAKSYIDRYVVLEAKRRLVIEQCDIDSLAEYLGFKETTNFTKFFKRHTQISPSHFRDNV
ncbi:AraC family transcriptional regulator [Colwellia sp. RE-S-Sl-9]